MLFNIPKVDKWIELKGQFLNSTKLMHFHIIGGVGVVQF